MSNAAIDGTTFPDALSDTERRERRFFLGMALIIAVTMVCGFGSWALRGMVVRPIPFMVHIHAVLFIGWVGVFIAQTALISADRVDLHRKLGLSAVGLAVAMLIAGTAVALESVRLGRVPPFFPENIFLALNFLELVLFGLMLAAAVLLRRRTDWHRRLALGATICLLGPPWGRILPMTLLGPFGGLAIMGVKTLYVGAAMAFDVQTRGKIHAAHYWTLLAVLIDGVGPPLLGNTAPFVSLVKALTSA